MHVINIQLVLIGNSNYNNISNKKLKKIPLNVLLQGEQIFIIYKLLAINEYIIICGFYCDWMLKVSSVTF